jgi:hypothetical protein
MNTELAGFDRGISGYAYYYSLGGLREDANSEEPAYVI